MEKTVMWRNRFIVLMMCLLSIVPAQAQDNLLSNAGFEYNYSGRGRGDFNFAENWGGWFTESPRSEGWMNLPPNAFPHTSYYKYSGTTAQSISKGGGTFTAAAYQEVGNIPAGAIVRGSAFVFLENVSDSQAKVRVGVGSNVGGNPFGGDVTWSPWMTSPFNEYRQISVDHIAAGGNVTIFIYATQGWPNDPNAVYMDDASLVIVGNSSDLPQNNPEEETESSTDSSSSGSSGSSGSSAAAPALQPGGVAFVQPQDTSARDGITHTVTSGDTLWSIASGYGVSVDQVLSLNGLDKSSILQIGQVLTIAEPDPDAPEVTPEPETTPEPEVTPEPDVPTDTEAVPDAPADIVLPDTPADVVADAPEELEPAQPNDSTEVVQLDTVPADNPSADMPTIPRDMLNNVTVNCSLNISLNYPYIRLTCGTEN